MPITAARHALLVTPGIYRQVEDDAWLANRVNAGDISITSQSESRKKLLPRHDGTAEVAEKLPGHAILPTVDGADFPFDDDTRNARSTPRRACACWRAALDSRYWPCRRARYVARQE